MQPGAGALSWACAAILLGAACHARATTEQPADPAAQLSAPGTVPAPAAVTEPAAEIIYAQPTTFDRVGRVLAPVMVNGQGPFRFILDTGANRSVLSPRVAQLLGLTPSAETSINVHGITGSAVLPAVEIDELRAGNLTVVRGKRMPVLPETVLADADGILGVEGLSNSRIDVDFAEGTVIITRSRGTPAGKGVLTVPASLRHRGLLVADGRVGRVRIKAIIDTGAERTLGNAALRSALELEPSRTQGYGLATVHGATPALGEGTSLRAPTIFLGETELENLEVTFGDLYVFKLWGLEEQPALLIGMDLLGTVQRLVIDYRRRELQILPWSKAAH